MKAFLLLVTWFTSNQPPSNYQVTFSSLEDCQTARLQVLKDAERMRQEMRERLTRESQQFNLPGMVVGTKMLQAPSVSAVCVSQ
jgi:hypothetical protein